MESTRYPYPHSLIASIECSIDHVISGVVNRMYESIYMITGSPSRQCSYRAFHMLASILDGRVSRIHLYSANQSNPLSIIELALLIREAGRSTIVLGPVDAGLNIILYAAASASRKNVSEILIYDPDTGSYTMLPTWALSLSSTSESESRITILKAIIEKKKTSIRELQEATGYARSTVMKQVRWLSRARLIEYKLGVAKPLIGGNTLKHIETAKLHPP